MTAPAAWVHALDEFEERVTFAEQTLDVSGERDDADGDATAVPTFQRPGPLPAPFPPELLERARALLARATALEERLEAAQRDVRTELNRIPRLPSAASRPEPTSRLDFHA
jgi:hypothetical protein